ncbi:MAG: SUF system NifU family Fe-S cluster assembly protein [Planctomycetota bacterium]|nr:SUF system NifU family Fe-S cluster assembly protein [Planctomycetota bacterium]
MSDLRDLYNDVILGHTKRPRNFGPLDGATGSAVGFNPLCGDKFVVRVRVEDDMIADVRFEGEGCSISKASASVMTETLKGQSVAEAKRLGLVFRDLAMGNIDGAQRLEDLGKMAVFSGVAEYPVRVKCATLAWHTVEAALAGSDQPVSTE